ISVILGAGLSLSYLSKKPIPPQFFLQIVPRLTSFSLSSFTTGSNLNLVGSGFVEGDITVNFGSVPLIDPSVLGAIIDVYSLATRMNVTIPSGAESNVFVTTAGGVSNTLIVN
ncbi:MAG: hypothetical protein O2821_12020, partial [Chloroflexi bacterium]|nr:hypothetical protein [Chloroflexota bacterium]MDA1227081.1 hypothetical protein [Chloroflexota bacterium]